MLISLPHIDTHTHAQTHTHTEETSGRSRDSSCQGVSCSLHTQGYQHSHFSLDWLQDGGAKDGWNQNSGGDLASMIWKKKKKNMNSTVWHISIKRRKQTNSPVERWFWAPALEWNCSPVTPAWPLTRWAAWGQFLSEALFAHLIFNFFFKSSLAALGELL